MSDAAGRGVAPLGFARPHRRPLLWRRAREAAASDAAFAVWVMLAGLLLARLLVQQQWQLALTLVAVAATVPVYAVAPSAGVAALVALWMLAPFVRRLLDTISVGTGPDLLSLAPFLATAGVALVALRRAAPPRAARMAIAAFWAALLIGVPAGLAQPGAAAFGLFAYVAGSLALFIGYVDGRRRLFALQRALLWSIPVLVAYGFYQYILPLPFWDELWLRTQAPVSVGTKEAGTFKIFSLLNAPATMATVLAVFLIAVLARRRFDPLSLVVAVPAAASLALTSVRTAWLSLAAAAVLLVPLSRGRAIPRVGLLVGVLGILLLTLGNTTAGEGVTQRFSTLGDRENDQSISARIATVVTLGPQAVSAPLGHGLGTVGQAARASASASELVDNGLMILIWQVGPLGFLLAIGAIGYLLRDAVRGPPVGTGDLRTQALAPVLLLLIAMISNEGFYGLSAVLLWYYLGALLGTRDAAREEASAGA